MSESWVLADFEAGLKQLETALSGPIKSDLERAGCIQYFEFTFELAWKSIRMTASELGQPDCLSSKACLKQAFTNGWIGNEEAWLKMLDARNRMSHTYLSGKRRAESVRVPERFSAAVRSIAWRPQKVRRMKISAPVMIEDGDSQRAPTDTIPSLGVVGLKVVSDL